MPECESVKAILFDSSQTKENRLEALKELVKLYKSGELEMAEQGNAVNNHIHTCYSFSPYTPSAAIYSARCAGLKTAGIMDHDSVGGADEFIKSGEILGMPTTVGCEMRVSVKGTALEGKRLNNPDQLSCAYVAMHGIPHGSFSEIEAVLAEKRKKRNERNRRMCLKINELALPYGIKKISFEEDVLPLSKYSEGGSITERHVLFALTKALISAYPDRKEAVSVIEKMSGTFLSEKKKESLLSASGELYEYDLLGVMKSSLIEKIYIDANEELLHISEFIKLAKDVGAISAYAYLGDVCESPTGDKKAQKFEDDYIELLFDELKKLGFNAVTYMPSRNTPEQLSKVMALCKKFGFFEISGEDINSPRQSFICPAAEKKEFMHLKTATYALIGHEICASENISNSMFSPENIGRSLEERIKYFAAKGGSK